MSLRRSRSLLLTDLFRLVVPLLLAILVGPALAQSPAGTAGRPNFLLILSDDQRHDTIDYVPAPRRAYSVKGSAFRTPILRRRCAVRVAPVS